MSIRLGKEAATELGEWLETFKCQAGATERTMNSRKIADEGQLMLNSGLNVLLTSFRWSDRTLLETRTMLTKLKTKCVRQTSAGKIWVALRHSKCTWFQRPCAS